ncbi:hypothetical protein OKA04_12980 [Luteolibacter flavescens]|uniref:DUF1460 domain-containing protein n=1 Tax=Luteolibacter flavescens TaxID=1859460 RepID=A0ABT3FPZ2_9BACT|nr:hypothetical protein [Luteolibacter flavescens]MCW1885646.1 hypothetical protein [Luteolibacter flavescens]
MSAPLVTKPAPDSARYEELKEEAERWRKDLSSKYAKARTNEEKDRVIAETRSFLETLLPEMMLCWLGTPWDFNGTSEVPGEGKIACGYFVSTVLRDAGFKLDRYKLARQPSQNIIRTFLPADAMTLRVGVSYDTFAGELAMVEPGVRIIGLDSHVAFLVTRPDGFRFIHSSGSAPWCVVDEDREAAEVLRRSNYRVHGLLTGDRTVLLRWLRAEKIAVKESSTASS